MEAIYNAIGTGYNTTRQADPYLSSRLLYFLAPQPDELYLDIGCGTGNYTIALSNPGLNFTGVEPSDQMLKEARKRDGRVNWLQGSAEHIPVNDNIFNGVIATLTIHHWTELDKSLEEIYRVTKNNGKIVFFTAAPRQMEGYWLNYYFPRMLRSAIVQMPALDKIRGALTKAGFEITATEKYFVHEGLQDHFLYAGKHHPELYFNEDVRKGISSFAALANVEEVEQGLPKLCSDINEGKFLSIKKSYENEHGDYLFIAAIKN